VETCYLKLLHKFTFPLKANTSPRMMEMASKLVLHGFEGACGRGLYDTVTQLRLGVVSATTGLTVVVVVVVVGLSVLGANGLSGRFGLTPVQQ